MANIADIIKYEGDNSTFIWKHPCEDFNTMTQLIVHESQEAIFFMNGQALDLFGPGRYTLETQNIPEIGKHLNKATGNQTPFHCEVYFINKTVQMGTKWGTPDRIRFIEPTLDIPVNIGASGEMNLMVSNARKLLVKLVGTMNGIAWDDRGVGFTKSLKESFRPLITNSVRAHLSGSIKDQGIDLFEIDEHLEELSEIMRQKLIPGFEEYGLTIPQFYISSLILPEDDHNFKKLKELHSISLQTKIAEAEQEIIRSRRGVALEHETTETEILKRRQERELLQAQTDAAAKRIEGFTEAEIRERQGFTMSTEAQFELEKERARAMGQLGSNSQGGGAMGDMMTLGMTMAMMPQMAEMAKGVTSQMNQPAPHGASEAKAETVCAKCGSVIPENSKFCLECGEKIAAPAPEGMVVCPSCGKTVAKGKFCLECGHKFLTNCPKCGAEIIGGAKFCLECGEKL